MSRRMPLALLALLPVLLTAAPAAAQYVWKEPNGRMVFSDLPPPPGTPTADIVRAAPAASTLRKSSPVTDVPGAAPTVPADPLAPRSVEFKPASSVPNMPTGPQGAASPVVQSGPDKALQQRRREAEQTANNTRAAEDQTRANQRRQDCATARNDLRTLETGVPMLITSSDGSLEVLPESQRESRAQRLRTALAQCEK